MIRKVLTIGQSSYAVTLPKDFIKEHQLEPGNEIILSHEAGTIIICKEQPQLYIHANLSAIQELQHNDFFSILLQAFFLTGAKKVRLQGIHASIQEKITQAIEQTDLHFYKTQFGDESSEISCPIHVEEGEELENLVFRSLQLLYACFENISRTPCSARRHIRLAQRAISQNFNRREHLSMYSFLHTLDIIAETVQKYSEKPEYLSQYANVIYYMQQTLCNPQICMFSKVLEQLDITEEEIQKLPEKEYVQAKHILTCLHHALKSLMTYYTHKYNKST